MLVQFLTLFLTICTVGTSFQCSHRIHCRNLSRPSPDTTLCLSDSSDKADGLLNVGDDDVSGEETILRINFSFNSENGGSALDAVQTYTKSFPFAAVLPVQPLTYLPGEERISVSRFETNDSFLHEC